MSIKRPQIFKMVDMLYNHHFVNTSKLYDKGVSLLIEGTISKIACLASIEHCDKQINSLKPNTKKSIYNGDRYSDELTYWITVKEILKNKLLGK